MSDPTKFSDLARTRIAHFEIPLLAETLVDATFVVLQVAFETGDLGDYAILHTDAGDFRTSSKVLLEQLRMVEQSIKDKKTGVEVTLRTIKSKDGRIYYSFE